MKRLISAFTSDVKQYDKKELKQAILASEGRVVMSETIITYETPLRNISNPEIARAFGADMILLNFFDCEKPFVSGLPSVKNPVSLLKEYTGLPIGCNLEPVDLERELLEDRVLIPAGRCASKETFIKANELGLDYICLTGNPGVGVSNQAILNSIKCAKENFKGLIIAGKMHGAGVKEDIFDLNLIEEFISAGADIILLPALNTVPGVTEELLKKACDLIHSKGALALAAIGTSQESSDTDTIRQIGLANKRCGIDISHIGDAGYGGIAIPENIMALSIAIKGRRHTYFRMSASIKR